MSVEWVEIGDARLACGDCLEILQQVQKVDAVVTDPPFFTPAVHYQSRVEFKKTWGDLTVLGYWWQGVAKLLEQICPNGHVFVFCNSESYPLFFKAMYSSWEKLKCMVWDKGHVGLGRIFRNQHELIIWARSQGHFLVDDGVLRSDILKAKATPSSQRLHPVEKPPELLMQLAEISPLSGTICDPFMGSGTTGVACANLGRKFIGIEIEPAYFEIACKRIKNAYAQPRLFEPSRIYPTQMDLEP